MVLYFSKINLISDKLFEIYEEPEKMREVLDAVLVSIGKMDYEKIEKKMGDDGEVHDIKTTYKLYIRRKEDTFVEGRVHKQSRLFYKEDDGSGDLKSRFVDNAEAIRFYFEIYNETVGFHTAQRFGFQEFNDAFISLVNKCLEKGGYQYKFDIALRTEGLNIDEIMEGLSQIEHVRSLKLKYQPPNPEGKYLNNMIEDGESIVSSLKEANVTGMTTEFISKGNLGLSLQAQLIRKNIEQMQSYSQVIDNKHAIGRGYIGVEATGMDGKRYTTAEKKPVKTEIQNPEDFIAACKNTILKLLV